MQIPHTSLAASVAAITARNVPDKENKADSLNPNQHIHVEQTGESNADRDAQGQGDGQPARKKKKEEQPQETTLPSNLSNQGDSTAPDLPGDPPSQLDLLG